MSRRARFLILSLTIVAVIAASSCKRTDETDRGNGMTAAGSEANVAPTSSTDTMATSTGGASTASGTSAGVTETGGGNTGTTTSITGTVAPLSARTETHGGANVKKY